jgi:SAM-dependent methyltransferase
LSDTPYRFDNGAIYDRGMGEWSRLVGEQFLDWLAPEAGLRWIDVGCGSGAFTAQLLARCAPAGMQGVDPAQGQIDFATSRADTKRATFRIGDAQALPFADDSFDAAVMALVIFFVPDPARGASEMARVVRPGGLVAAYAWDFLGGGSPGAPLQAELNAIGIATTHPPSVQVSRRDALAALWRDAGLQDVETHEIVAERGFADFDAAWDSIRITGSAPLALRKLPPETVERVREAVRVRLGAAAGGGVRFSARANAVRGRVPSG